MEHNADQDALMLIEFGALLGPEETSGWVCSWWPPVATGHLTLEFVRVVVVGVVGCGCLLSVA